MLPPGSTLKGMPVLMISTNLGPFGVNSSHNILCHLASEGILQFSKNCIVSLEIRDLENLLFSAACLLANCVAEWIRAYSSSSIAIDRKD